MSMKPWKWGVALSLSGVLHAAAAITLMPSQPEVQVAGGAGTGIALAGTAFVGMFAAGTPFDTIEPAAEEATTITPVEPNATAEPIQATEAPSIEPMEQAAPQPPITMPAETAAEAETPEIETAEPALAESETAESDLAEIEPSQPQEEAVSMVPIPRPTPRPHYEKPKTERRQAQAALRKQTAQPPAQSPTERSGGSGGRDSHDARRGTADGRNTANGTVSKGGGRIAGTGNAAVSNYPGKIVAKLKRSLRYPRAAQRERLRGEVSIAFTVSTNGSVASIRVVSSSGSPILDQAAIETVQRAAPFPAIPPSAGRSSWPFTVPLAFVR